MPFESSMTTGLGALSAILLWIASSTGGIESGGPPSAEFRLRRMYTDLVGRPPLPAELAEGLKLSKEELATKLVASLEHHVLWYEDELFYFLLLDDFRPADERLQAIPKRMQSGDLNVRDAIGEIVRSQWFTARNPGNDTYVTVVLEQLLGIVVQKEPGLLEAGKKMYDGYTSTVFGKRGSSQGDFVDIVFDQPLLATTYVARHAKRILGSDIPKKDLAALADRFRAAPASFPQIEKELVLSPAWEDALQRGRKKSDQQFIRGLYQDLFGRPPTYQEMRNVRNATQALADPIGIRSVIIRTILDSGKVELPEKSSVDAAEWIKSRFRTYLFRDPGAAELKTFTDAWQSEGCRPATIVHAILTGTEYQYY
jgi:hypothetical protein